MSRSRSWTLWKAIWQRQITLYCYQLERNGVRAAKKANSIEIRVGDLAAVPVRGLRWDYLIGEIG